jgi:hypothetical protein
MKQPVAFFQWRPFLVMLFLSLVSLAIWGQEEGNETSIPTSTANTPNVSATDTAWYTSPWVWVIGVAVIILLLVALLSSQGTADKERISRIIKKDTPSTAA